MIKWCITWEDAEYFIKAFRAKEEEKLKKGKIAYMDSDSLAYALKSLFKHRGFWMEENNE